MQITFSHSILLCNSRMSIPSLETILDSELAEMIVNRSAEIIPQDGILFRQGEPADCLYFVRSGEANLTMQSGDKQFRIRAGLRSLLGIPAIVGNQPYSMTATAGRDAETFRLSSIAFNDLIKTEPKMQEAVLRILAGEVRVARQALSDLSLWSED
jgi:CRP-like cAMP-binding protein